MQEKTHHSTGRHLGKTALARMLRDGTIVRHRPGLFWEAKVFAATPAAARHAAAAIRTVELLNGEYVLARESAAAVLGIPTPRGWRDGREPIQLYAWTGRNALIGAGLHLYASPLLEVEVVSIEGQLLTGVPRTSIDLARGESLPKALVALDGALRTGATSDELPLQLSRQRGWRGTSRLGKYIDHASCLAESALESESRGHFIEKGLPTPNLQAPVTGLSGREYRVDFAWLEFGVVGEADGWGKFGTTEVERERNFAREKVREDDIRNADHRVIRWTYRTLRAVVEQLVPLLR